MTGRSRCCGPCRRPPPATRQRPPAGAGTRPTGAQRSCAAWDWCLAAGRLTGWSMPSGRSPAPRCSPSWCWIGAGRCKATSGGWSTRSERCWGAGDRDGIQGRGRGRLVWPYGRHRRHGLPACGRGEPAGDVAAVGFDLNPISHPLILLHQGATGATLWHWAMMLDILGYYLLIVPLILALRSWLRPSSPNWIDLAVLYLLAYGGIGAIGGAILATAIPPLIRGYAMAGPHRVVVETVFTGYSDAVYRGMWNLLEQFLADVGWLAVGVVLRSEDRRLGRVTTVLGLACLVDAFGTAMNVDAVATTGLSVYLVLAPI